MIHRLQDELDSSGEFAFAVFMAFRLSVEVISGGLGHEWGGMNLPSMKRIPVKHRARSKYRASLLPIHSPPLTQRDELRRFFLRMVFPACRHQRACSFLMTAKNTGDASGQEIVTAGLK